VSEIEAISVTQFARRIRNLLEIQLGELWIEGEVSNLRKQSSGHWYFSLKDESAQIFCAMFGASRREGNQSLKDGAKVQIFGETSFYEARGTTQIIVQKVRAKGLGDLQARFEALKKKLNQEGLFDSDRKRSLPAFPRVVGIVTSSTGAALQDILNVLQRRSPWLKVVLFPSAVQGKGAESSIARAIESASHASALGLPKPDVLIVGRGGGSLEDLWNFNEEVVARAIFSSPIPIVSAVGHEIDFTISDFVADLRAPTPSAAAELVAPDREDLVDRLEGLDKRLRREVHGVLNRLSEQLDYYERSVLNRDSERLFQGQIIRLERVMSRFSKLVEQSLSQREFVVAKYQANWSYYHPREVLKRQQEKLEAKTTKFLYSVSTLLGNQEARVEKLGAMLHVLGPENILERGFSITFNDRGEIIKDAATLSHGDELQTKLFRGEIVSRVESV